MFTGIIEELGTVRSITANKICITADTVLEGTKIGDSIAINGVCLTVTNLYNYGFDADISPETVNVTTFGSLKNGDFVNLERAIMAGARFGGHIVTGHVDCIGKIKEFRREGNFYNLKINLEPEQAKYTAKKGSITVNGISLTVADINGDNITIAVIPHTFENTNLKALHIGDYVNIETDILAKYVEKFLSTSDNKSGISMEFLQEHGF